VSDPARAPCIVAACRREQQALVDEWLPWLIDPEERRPDVAACELPGLSSAYSPCPVVHRRRHGARRRDRRRQSRARARAARHRHDGGLRVDRSGRVLARQHGGFDDQKATRLSAALERSSADG
jgi:hypothetical protein